MRKTIKLDEEVYARLENFRDKRETFSQAVERLLNASERFLNLIAALKPDRERTDRDDK